MGGPFQSEDLNYDTCALGDSSDAQSKARQNNHEVKLTKLRTIYKAVDAD